jgi:hypothetical protein
MARRHHLLTIARGAADARPNISGDLRKKFGKQRQELDDRSQEMPDSWSDECYICCRHVKLV